MNHKPQPSRAYTVLIYVIDANTGELMQELPSWSPLYAAFMCLAARYPEPIDIEATSAEDESCAVFFTPPQVSI
jgi:hypothetical protein